MTMEITYETIMSAIGLIFGSSGIGALITWRYQRNKAKAEAKREEADAAKELQDVYQQLIVDIKADREEQKVYIGELKEDRAHLRKDRDELRKRQDELEEQVRNLQRDVARNSRMVGFMRPLLCGREDCAIRVPVTISEAGVVRPGKAEIEPYDDKIDS